MRKKVVLYFGSFNPVHVGHLALANYVCEYAEIDELWFVVTPRNPFKEGADLMDDDLRLEKRGTDAPEVIDSRVKRAEFELSYAPLYDVVIVNDDLQTALAEALAVVKNFLKDETTEERPVSEDV